MLQAGKSPVRIPDEVDLFNLPNPSSHTMALGSTQPLREMSTRNFPGGKKRPARRADNLAAICEPNVCKCGSLNLSQPYRPPRPLQGNFTLAFTCLDAMTCAQIFRSLRISVHWNSGFSLPHFCFSRGSCGLLG
jgi:hypothetical protein